MKNILQINTLNETGSTGRIVQNISNCISETGNTCYTAYGYGKSQLKNSYRIGTWFEYLVHNFLSRVFCAQGHFSYFATRRLIHWIQEKDIDLIHLHNIHGNYLNYPLLFKFIKQNNIPVVWTMHDCWPITGKCVHFDYCQCNQWKSNCKKCPILPDYPQSYFLDHCYRDYRLKKDLFTNVDNLILVTPSAWLKDNVKQSFLKEKECIVINNGIDISQFKPSNSHLREMYGLKNKKIILGVASPWTKRKGLDDFLKLSEMISEGSVIVLIGLEDTQCKNLPKNIIGLCKTESINELAQWYTIADVFVNPTYEDNFPTVNMEALSCNTRVVAYDTGGCKEVIKEGYGFICEKGNIHQLYSLIKKALDLPKLENGYDYIRKNYNESVVFKKYMEVYSKLLNK